MSDNKPRTLINIESDYLISNNAVTAILDILGLATNTADLDSESIANISILMQEESKKQQALFYEAYKLAKTAK